MKLSSDRILTTHVGSLPRPTDLLTSLEAHEAGHGFDRKAFETRLTNAVREVVAKQAAAGIDCVCDGEQSKISYTFYVRHRLQGLVRSEAATTTSRRRPQRIATCSTTPITCSV